TRGQRAPTSREPGAGHGVGLEAGRSRPRTARGADGFSRWRRLGPAVDARSSLWRRLRPRRGRALLPAAPPEAPRWTRAPLCRTDRAPAVDARSASLHSADDTPRLAP